MGGDDLRGRTGKALGRISMGWTWLLPRLELASLQPKLKQPFAPGESVSSSLLIRTDGDRDVLDKESGVTAWRKLGTTSSQPTTAKWMLTRTSQDVPSWRKHSPSLITLVRCLL